jgi:hypothetical protein
MKAEKWLPATFQLGSSQNPGNVLTNRKTRIAVFKTLGVFNRLL